jgi:anti-anti-sigma regulatory factor
MEENILKLNGNLSISAAHKIHKNILDALAHPGDIIVDIKESKKMDISFLQLLCSLNTSCLENKKKMKIKADDNFRMLLKNAGYLRGELLNFKN